MYFESRDGLNRMAIAKDPPPPPPPLPNTQRNISFSGHVRQVCGGGAEHASNENLSEYRVGILL